MMKNEELIKALRWCGSDDEQHEWCVDASYSCPMWNEDRMTDYCKAELMTVAADALEAAEHRIADLKTALAACRLRAEKGRECRFDCDFYDWTVGTCGGECVMLCEAVRGEHDE